MRRSPDQYPGPTAAAGLRAVLKSRIPSDLPRMYGRDEDVEWLVRAVTFPGAVVLVGPPGVGKTLLAQRFAQQIADAGPFAGVWYCSVEHARTPDQLLNAIARVLGVHPIPGQGTAQERLTAALVARGRVLLVLDGVDGVRNGVAALLREWHGLVGLTVLVTTRRDLGVHDEQARQVGPLAVDVGVKLFVKAARVWRPSLRPRRTDAPVLKHLVYRVGTPLAIRLVASRVGAIPAGPLDQTIRAWVGDSLPAQGADLESALAAVAQWVWHGLHPVERQALARLSMLPGGFTSATATRVLDLPNLLDAPRPEELLERLEVAGWLRRGRDPTADYRYYACDPVRALGEGALRESGLEAELIDVVAACVLERAERWTQELPDPAPGGNPGFLVFEQVNLEHLVQCCAERHPDLAVRAALCLAPLYAAFGPPQAELALLDATVSIAARATDGLRLRVSAARARALAHRGRGEAALQELDRARAGSPAGTDRTIRGYLSLVTGHQCLALGLVERAEHAYDDAYQVARQSPDPHLLPRALAAQGGLAWRRYDPVGATRRLQQAVAQAAELGDRTLVCRLQTNLGVALLDAHQPIPAEEELRSAFALARELRRASLGVAAAYNLGLVLLASGRADEAERALRGARKAIRRVSDHRSAATWLGHLGVLRHLQGRGVASELYGAAIGRALLAADRWLLGTLLAFKGAMWADCDDLVRSETFFGAAREALGRGAFEAREAIETLYGHVDLARARRATGDAGGALALIDRAQARLEQTDHTVARSAHVRLARATLEAAIARTPEPATRLEIGPNGAWFKVHGGPQVPLQQRDLRATLLKLFQYRLHSPGRAVPGYEIVSSAWPDQMMEAEVEGRVSEAVGALGELGLGRVLVEHAEGWLLDPDVEVATY